MNSLPKDTLALKTPPLLSQVFPVRASAPDLNVLEMIDRCNPRARYWSVRMSEHKHWLTAGGFAQEECGPADLRNNTPRAMPADAEFARFYAAAAQVLATAMGPRNPVALACPAPESQAKDDLSDFGDDAQSFAHSS